MGSLLQITTLVLFWCFCSAFVALYLCFFYQKKIFKLTGYVSALLLAPIIIGLFAFFFHQSLIFPSLLASTLQERFLSAMIPGVLLFFSSGWFFELSFLVVDQKAFWSTKPFFLASLSFGKNPNKQIKKIVLVKSFLESFHRILPVFIGELFLIEILFNINGICFDFWLKIKERDMTGSIFYLSLLSAVYFVLHGLLLSVKSFIGRRLEGYT